MKDSKIVLILEKSSKQLDVTRNGNEVILEGVFAQFGILNNNNRIYEEVEYLPHMEYLVKKISENKLLGELDHPEKFDISLSKVSHVIEKLEYDKAKRQVHGRVRLLDTPSGKIAKELVESGIPISISSRAAGLVESNNKVKIKKIFTYDLVADPGFENAVLSRMNESLGIVNENIAIYDVTSKYPELLEDYNEKSETKTNSSDNMKYVTSEELNTYSLILKDEIEGINKKIGSIKENEELIEQVGTLSKAFTKMQKYVDYLANTIDENVKESNSFNDKLDKIVDYTNYVSNTLDESINYIKYVADKTDKSIQYGEYLKEQLEKGIDYTEYLKECIEKGVSYAEYLASKLDEGIEYSETISTRVEKGIEYSDYVAKNANEILEKLNDTVAYTNYLGENLNKGISYGEYIGEKAQELADYTEFMLNEKSDTTTANSAKVNESKTTDYSSLTDKVDNIIESIKKQKIDNVNSILDETKKQTVSTALNENSQQQADSMINNLMSNSQEITEEEKWLSGAPQEFKQIWESMDTQMKNTITGQSKFYKLETPYQIKNFWETRNLNKPAGINESKIQETPTALGYTPSYLDNIKSSLDRFGKK